MYDSIEQTSSKMLVIYVKDVPGLGRQIKHARIDQNQTIRGMAALTGISPTFWHDCEQERTSIRYETVKRMEQALEVNLLEE